MAKAQPYKYRDYRSEPLHLVRMLSFKVFKELCVQTTSKFRSLLGLPNSISRLFLRWQDCKLITAASLWHGTQQKHCRVEMHTNWQCMFKYPSSLMKKKGQRGEFNFNPMQFHCNTLMTPLIGTHHIVISKWNLYFRSLLMLHFWNEALILTGHIWLAAFQVLKLHTWLVPPHRESTGTGDSITWAGEQGTWNVLHSDVE